MKLHPALLIPWLYLIGVAHAHITQSVGLQVPTEQLLVTALELQAPYEATASAMQPMAIHESKSEVRIELSADILFHFDKSEILPSAAEALHNAAELIRARGTGQVRIEGYTDSKGGTAYNQRLSARRAKAVAGWLRSNESLQAQHFTEVGLGAANPVAPNNRPDGSDNPEGRRRNRRVELVIPKD
jgi:outer membrane protein OmpA-like peptidoglycan-associated protein